MKKIIAALLLLALCSCSSPEPTKSTAPPEQQTTTAVITETVTEPETTATEIPPAPTTEPPTEPEVNDLLFESDGLKLYYQGVEQNSVKIGVENYSTVAPCAIHIFMNNITVNAENIVGERGIESYIGEQTSETLYYNLPLDELQSRNISRINSLEFDFFMYAGDWTLQTESFAITR